MIFFSMTFQLLYSLQISTFWKTLNHVSLPTSFQKPHCYSVEQFLASTKSFLKSFFSLPSMRDFTCRRFTSKMPPEMSPVVVCPC